MLDLLESGLVDYIVSTSPHGRDPHRDSVKFRRKATALSIPLSLIHIFPEPEPLVSILIPNKDHPDDLEKCLHSICLLYTSRCV